MEPRDLAPCRDTIELVNIQLHVCCGVHLQVETLQEAIDLVNANPYGNGTAIFTDSGSAARRFQHDVQVCVTGSLWETPLHV